jgi:hypothetical protein
MTFSIVAECCYADSPNADCPYADCHYADFHYADCRYADCRGAANRILKCSMTKNVPRLGNELGIFLFFPRSTAELVPR